jgi:hypothetical protein
MMGPHTEAVAYGVCANVYETDRIFRMGAKAWLGFATGGHDRCKWLAQARRGRWLHEKWAPIMRFHNFRAAFVPPPLIGVISVRGTREEMAALAQSLEDAAKEIRTQHPNRRLGFIEKHREELSQ